RSVCSVRRPITSAGGPRGERSPTARRRALRSSTTGSRSKRKKKFSPRPTTTTCITKPCGSPPDPAAQPNAPPPLTIHPPPRPPPGRTCAAAGSADEMVERLKRAIGPRTRVVGLTWVHSCTGVRLPVRRLTQVVADANASRGEEDRILVVLDAAHGFGNQEEALAQLGCDFAAAGTHKWIFAPRGTGIIWAPAKNSALLRPTIPTF